MEIDWLVGLTFIGAAIFWGIIVVFTRPCEKKGKNVVGELRLGQTVVFDGESYILVSRQHDILNGISSLEFRSAKDGYL